MPKVTAHSIHWGKVVVEHCVFTAADYANPDATGQQHGRAVLAGYGGVVMIPRKPLLAGETYTVDLTVDNVPYNWSFHVAASPH